MLEAGLSDARANKCVPFNKRCPTKIGKWRQGDYNGPNEFLSATLRKLMAQLNHKLLSRIQSSFRKIIILYFDNLFVLALIILCFCENSNETLLGNTVLYLPALQNNQEN